MANPRGRPFQKGRSGNPHGRPRGSRNRATVLRELPSTLHVESALTAPPIMLAALDAQDDDGEPLEAPAVFMANARNDSDMPVLDAVQTIARVAGLSADQRKRLARGLDRKHLDKLAQAIASIQALDDKSDPRTANPMPSVMLRAGR